MRKSIDFDSEDIVDQLIALSRLLNYINSHDICRVILYRENRMLYCFNKLVRYEKYHSKYIFVFEDHVETATGYIGRRITDDNNLPGFFMANRNDVINLTYMYRLDDDGVHLIGRDEVIEVSRGRRRELVKKLDL